MSEPAFGTAPAAPAAPANLRGAAWMLGALTGFTCSAVFVKFLGLAGTDAFFVSVGRGAIGLAIVVPLILAHGGLGILRTAAPGLHLLRAASGGGGMVLLYYAYVLLPLVEVTVLMFSVPLFTTILAALVLRERVGWRRWAAIGVGFIGVLVMLRPGAGLFRWEALLPLVTSLGFAISVSVVKLLPRGEGPLPMLFYFLMASLVLALPLTDWTWPAAPGAWGSLLAVGVISLGAQAMIIRAFQIGEVSFVTLFEYSKLLLAGGFGYVLFAEVPDRWSLLGGLIIILATVYIARREAVVAKRKTTT